MKHLYIQFEENGTKRLICHISKLIYTYKMMFCYIIEIHGNIYGNELYINYTWISRSNFTGVSVLIR